MLREHVWNWLPVFLRVAEEGSIAAASRKLHVTPAAVSRTLRLLEAELGEPLFSREGRSLVLNERGVRLRAALRDAVKTVDRGIARSLASPFAGPLRVGSLGVLTDHFVVETLLALREAYPRLLPEHRNISSRQGLEALAAGNLDVLFYYEELSHEALKLRSLASTSMSIYCAAGHPLFHGRLPRRGEILEHAFSVPQIGDAGRVLDGWPTEFERKVGMRITTLRSNLQVCLSGQLLCVLPDVTAFELWQEGRLRRLGAVTLPEIEIFVATRTDTLEEGASAQLIGRVKEKVSDFGVRFRRALRKSKAGRLGSASFNAG